MRSSLPTRDDGHEITPCDFGLRRVAAIVGLLNLGYFGIEFAVALAIGSVSLFADSIDFLEDASVSFLIFAALGWSAVRRARRNGASWNPAYTGSGDSVDDMGQIQRTGAP